MTTPWRSLEIPPAEPGAPALAGDRLTARVRNPRFAKIDARLLELCTEADAETRDLYPADRAEREELVAERRELSWYADAAATAPETWNQERRQDLEDAAAAVYPRAADLLAQLEADLEAERPRTPAETAIDRHRAAVAGAARYARSLAEHEAAHAVVGEVRGVRVVEACFLYNTPDGRLRGAETRFTTDFRDWVIDAAGAAVARVAGYTGRGSDGLSPSDVTNLARAGCRSVDQQELAMAAAGGCIRQHWSAVRRVAGELLERGHVSGAEVRRIIKESEP